MDKIKKLWHRSEGLVLYMLFGALTTVVNYGVYLPCLNYLHWSATISNIAAWVASVAVAFATNKPFVFKSHDWSAKVLLPELGRFVTCRLGSGFLETVIIFITVDCFSLNGNWMKLAVSVFVIVLNYIASKILVFRNTRS